MNLCSRQVYSRWYYGRGPKPKTRLSLDLPVKGRRVEALQCQTPAKYIKIKLDPVNVNDSWPRVRMLYNVVWLTTFKILTNKITEVIQVAPTMGNRCNTSDIDYLEWKYCRAFCDAYAEVHYMSFSISHHHMLNNESPAQVCQLQSRLLHQARERRMLAKHTCLPFSAGM